MSNITGPLISNFRTPLATRIVRDGPVEHIISVDNNIVHAIGTTGVSSGQRVVHITAPAVNLLEGFLREILVSTPRITSLPTLLSAEAFNGIVAPWLERIAFLQREPVIDLTDFTGWNQDVWRTQGRAENIGMRFILGQFIPSGLEFAKVWAMFDAYPNSAGSPTVDQFYAGRIIPAVRSFKLIEYP